LKKITIDQLTIGMFVQKIEAGWLNHPFWRSSFLLDSAELLTKIRNSKIKEIWIDPARGLDVQESQPAPAAGQEGRPPTPPSAPSRSVPLAQEMKRAASIFAESSVAITTMFKEARMGKAIETVQAREVVQEIAGSVIRNPSALVSIARIKTASEYTYMHSVAVCALMVALGRKMGMEESAIREAGLAGLLHDLGKAQIPIEILNKPAKLTDQEYAIIQTHPREGYRMLHEPPDVGSIAKDVCLHHHEKMDGTGYPDRLPAEEITTFARMGAICDVYDAVTSNRPYKAGWDPAESLQRMASWQGHFDPKIFQIFVKSLGIYPIGSFVRLTSGRMGVVIEQSERSLLLPKVKIFYSANSRSHIPVEIIDLSQRGGKEQIVGREDPGAWGITNSDEMWSGVPMTQAKG
jgi:HD-GYP domain-containing protein (c-di-GMP phosphodiesterase class II)